jgi:hypothetical protein
MHHPWQCTLEQGQLQMGLMFADTEQQAKAIRDPVAPAIRSASAQAKAESRTLTDGTPALVRAITL